MPATRRTRAQTAKASKVSLDTILLATAIGAGVAAYFSLDAAPEVVVTSKKPAAKKPATRKAAVSPKKPRGGSRATLEALASARSTPATRAELKTTLETLGVDFKSSDSTKYLQRKLENWLEEN